MPLLVNGIFILVMPPLGKMVSLYWNASHAIFQLKSVELQSSGTRRNHNVIVASKRRRGGGSFETHLKPKSRVNLISSWYLITLSNHFEKRTTRFTNISAPKIRVARCFAVIRALVFWGLWVKSFHALLHQMTKKSGLSVRSHKVLNPNDWCQGVHIALKFDKWIWSTAAEPPAKYQSDWQTLTTEIAPSGAAK